MNKENLMGLVFSVVALLIVFMALGVSIYTLD